MIRVVVTEFAATGYDSIDLEAAEEAGISVCVIDEYCTEEVADHTILVDVGSRPVALCVLRASTARTSVAV
jgi:hypothetical protein